MTLAWLCFMIGGAIAYAGAIRTLYRANRETLGAHERAPLRRVATSAVTTILITALTIAFGSALLVTLGWTFAEDLSLGHAITRQLAALLPVMSFAQGLYELIRQTTPPADADVGARARARWPFYATVNAPALVAGTARVIDTQGWFGEVGRTVLTDATWGGVIAELGGLALAAWITVRDARAAGRARAVPPPPPGGDNFPTV